MSVLLSNQDQVDFCKTILGRIVKEDEGSLLIMTQTGFSISSRKLLQIFSPVLKDILGDGSSLGPEPVTLILPETKIATVTQLLHILNFGEFKKDGSENNFIEKNNVVSLAMSLGIDLREIIESEHEDEDRGKQTGCDTSNSKVGKIRVRNIDELKETPLHFSAEEALSVRSTSGRGAHRKILDRKMKENKVPLLSDFQDSGKSDGQVLNFQNGVKSKYECGICNHNAETKLALFLHINKKHYGIKNLFHCKLCPKNFDRLQKLGQHLKGKHGKRMRRMEMSMDADYRTASFYYMIMS